MPLYPPASGGAMSTKDEGTLLSSTVTALNFVGAGVTASGAGSETTVTITGSAGSLNLNQLAPTGDQSITAGYCVYTSDYYEIADGFMLDILVDSVFEIG